MPIPPPPLLSLAVATRTDTATGVATTAAITVAATAVALSMGMSAAMFGFAAAGTNTNTSSTGGGGGAVVSGDPNLVSVGDQFVRGNANDDGWVNVADANFILNYLYNNGGKPVCMDAADVNDSGSVDLSDAKYLMDFLFNGTTAPRSPWPGRGVDPTPDGLICKPIMATLTVSVSQDPVSQNVVVGTKGFTFANVVLTATGEDVNVSAMKAEMVTALSAPNHYTNWKLFNGSTLLTTVNNPDPSSSTPGGATSTFTLASPLVVSRGTSKIVSVKADISVSAPEGGTIRVGLPTHIQDGKQITARTAGGGSVAVTLNTSDGQTMHHRSTGSLQITKSASSPDAGLLPSNTSGIAVGSFRMSATNETINIEKIWLSATGTRAWDGNPKNNQGPFNQVNTIYLYDGTTLLHSVSPTTTNSARVSGHTSVLFDLTSTPVVVPKDSVKEITVKVDTASVSRYTPSKGAPGQGFIFFLSTGGDITAKGAGSGSAISSDAINVRGSILNGQTVYVSVPTVALNDQLGNNGVSSGVLTSGVEKDLYYFRVKADSAGDIGLYRVSFLVTTSTATATRLTLFQNLNNTVALPSRPVIVRDGTIGNSEIYSFVFFQQGAGTGINPHPVTVSAGTAKSFILQGDLTCAITGITNNCGGSSGSGSIQVQLLGDSSFPTRYPDSAVNLERSVYEHSFIWGDYAMSGPLGVSSTTASTSEQWTNGFRVASESGKLPATSTAVTFSK